MNLRKATHKAIQRFRGLKRMHDLVKALNELRGGYPRMYVELSFIHSDNQWQTSFRFRGEIPWRERRYTLKSDSTTGSLEEHMERTVAFLREKIPVLKKYI